MSEEQDGWIEWAGGECPVPMMTILEVRFRDGGEARPCKARDWHTKGRTSSNWVHDGEEWDIIAYRVVSS